MYSISPSLIGQFRRGTGGFEMQDIGTCPAGTDFIEFKAECEWAAKLLGLADTTAGDNFHSGKPSRLLLQKERR